MMKSILKKPMRWALGALMVAGVAHTSAWANDAVVETVLPLGGTEAEPFASGSARYRAEGGNTSLEIEVEDLRSTDSVQFFVDGTLVGAAPVVLGQANFEAESESGAVPVLTANSAVQVRDLAGGTLVAATGNAVVNEGEDNTEGEGSVEGEDNTEGEGSVEGEDNSEGEGSVEGEDNSEGEGSVEGEDNSEGEGSVEGEDNSEGEGNDDAGEIEVEIALKGTANDPGATGQAELKNDNERRRIEVEVQGVSAATRVSVLVDGVNVGTSSVREGEAKVKRDERSNYTIPAVTNNSRVDVIDSANGNILLSSVDVVISPEGEGTVEGEGTPEGEGSTEGEVPPSTELTLHLKLGPNGTYMPGETTVIEAQISYTGDVPVTALSVEQTLPQGWTFVQSLNDLGAFLKPVASDSGTLTWAWLDVPAFPVVLRYEVQVPAEATGVQLLEGNVVYRRLTVEEYAVAKLDVPGGQGVAKTFCHDMDSNKSWTVELSELLRMIQFYNVDAYHCEAGTEDGFAPGQGDDACQGHDADQLSEDWSIDLSELLRTIQLFNAEDRAYLVQEGTEDGFRPGVFSLDK